LRGTFESGPRRFICRRRFGPLDRPAQSAPSSYVSAGYDRKGAKAASNKLLKDERICSRLAHLRKQFTGQVASETFSLAIADRNSRVRALQERWEILRNGLMVIIKERGEALKDFPGGASGLLTKDYRGTGPDQRVITRVDSGVISLFQELRAYEQQAAIEIGQWQAKVAVEHRTTIDATPAAIALSMILTVEQLEELERKVLEQQSATSPVPVSAAAPMLSSPSKVEVIR
jgi:hypothetical protein